MVDIIRLDHFIGYAKYYRIPIKDQTAHDGKWIQAPGDKLFQVLDSTIMDFNVIVEDLGDVTEDIISLRETYHFPGMRVLQFEFGKISPAEDLPENSVVCTGTHDNDTLLGWFESLPVKSSDEDMLTQNKLLKFFQCTKENIHWEIIGYALSTASYTVTIPLQDILGENSSARFNTPGTLSPDNWSWRMEEGKLTHSLKTKLAELTKRHNRNTSAVINLLKKEIESWK
jgi:4-alpha-glucanotransferase